LDTIEILETEYSLALDRINAAKAYRDKVEQDYKKWLAIYESAKKDVEDKCRVLSDLRELKEYQIAKQRADK
jgi:hypothetical protein